MEDPDSKTNQNTKHNQKNPSPRLERLGVVPIWRVLACSAHGSRFRAKKRKKEARTPSAGVTYSMIMS